MPTTAPSGPGVDPLWSSTVAILNLDGVNGSTVITDNSPLASNWVVDGTAKLTTAQMKFGTASLDLSDGAGFIRASAAASNFMFAVGQDFTFETWIYPTNVNQGILFDSRWNGFGYYTMYLSNGSVGWGFEPTGGDGATVTSAAGSVAANMWHHVAACRSGSTLRLFLNGALAGSIANAFAYNGVKTTERPILGQDGNVPYSAGGKFYGYVDSSRITRAARYTSAFSVPTKPFPVSA